MPPKACGAPKPAEFHITRLQAGRKSWLSGASGPPVAMKDFVGRGQISMPRKEVILVGKALFGRERFAFEVQEVDYSPAAVRKLLKKEKELQDARFGSFDGPFGFGGFGAEDSDDESRKPKGGPIDCMEAFKAKELAAKNSIQIKFQDIERIETVGDSVTLTLSKAPQCYAKPAGEPRTVNMEVVKDITGGAKTITFFFGAPPSEGSVRQRAESKALNFLDIRRLVMQHSPRLEALFRGLPPPVPALAEAGEVATPNHKRKRSDGQDSIGGSTKKQPRHKGSFFVQEITANHSTWLQNAVRRFGLKGSLDPAVTEEQWKTYFQQRVLLELQEAATLKGKSDDDQHESDSDREEHESVFAGATWPQELGPKPKITHMCFESYKDGSEEREMATTILGKIRKSVMATLASSSFQMDPELVSRGVFLRSYHVNDADEGEPRTVNTHARIYAPNGSGHFVDLEYENHKRVRMSFTERFSHLYASRGGPGIQELASSASRRGKNDGFEKIFELDFNECRRKNPTKTSLASNATLTNLGVHLFGAEGAMSNRKVFGLLVRAAGLGKFGENNGWPIAVARRRFKYGKEESETDTEPIAGETCADADVDGCCMM